MLRFLAAFFSRVIPWVIFAHTLVFIVFWLTNSLFYASSNDYLAGMLGKRMDYVSLLIWVSAFIAAWSLARGILGLLHQTHKLITLTSWVYAFVALIYIIFFYASFWLLFRESPVQLVRIGQLIGFYRLIVDGVLFLGLALLVAYLFGHFLHQRVGMAHNWPLWLGVVVIVLALWSLPLIFPPDSVYREALASKPFIIAHRGASMLAPENTIASAELAAELGVYGLETDIQVSLDGQLFLMHDDTLDRTTDVKTKFPGRENEPAEDFTLAEISQLNAGEWFVKTDPFHTIAKGLVTPEQVQEYRLQTVPLLSGWIDILRQNAPMVFIYDLKPPRPGHPYAASLFELAFNQVRELGKDPLIWLLVDPGQVQAVRQRAPYITLAFGADYRSLPDAAQLKDQGYQIVNVEYGISPRWIRSYQAQPLWVNVYTVDEPWQFSRLWLLGVNSVTTSNSQVMVNLLRPIFSLAWSQFLLVWGLVGLVGLGLALATLSHYLQNLAIQ